jgi:hypothetical protein
MVNPMARLKIVVDGETLVDHNPGDWQQPQPENIAERMQRLAQGGGMQQQPWRAPLLVAIGPYLAQGKAVTAEVKTHTGGYVLAVDHGAST